MKKTLVLAAVIAAGTAAHAEMIEAGTAADDSKNFDGFHLGGEVGYLNDSSDLNGVYFGGFAGYRRQLDSNVVIGVEGTFGKPDIDETTLGVTAEVDNLWTAMGSVGFVTGAEGRDLWSLGVGYAQTKASATYSGTEVSDTSSGVGGFVGYERAMGDNLSLRVRVTTYEFDSYQGTVGLGFRF